MKYTNLILFLFGFQILNTHIDLYSDNLEQTPWKKEAVQGFPIFNNELEITEGFGAYMDLNLWANTKNFDNGGGNFDFNTQFLSRYYGVKNIVFDPFQRSDEHNQIALIEIQKHDFDTTTSNSVLNVIDRQDARFKHILLSCDSLKEGGSAFFKVYPGNSSFVEQWHQDGYQSNRTAKTYQEDVEVIFGKGNVVANVERHLLIAYKNNGCNEPK
ncbi:MAG: hypothetical protein H0W88_07345 [Parachlamydiaceae bacterium]|nr:hypothetical protein [Parachlamydiaceae bacterium]